MFRWGIVLLVAGAIFSHFTPVAYACNEGLEGAASSGGHYAIAFCCGAGDAKNDARGSKSRIVSGFQGRAK